MRNPRTRAATAVIVAGGRREICSADEADEAKNAGRDREDGGELQFDGEFKKLEVER